MFLGKARVSTVVRARRVNAVLVADHLPELRADLVAALAALDVPSKQAYLQWVYQKQNENPYRDPVRQNVPRDPSWCGIDKTHSTTHNGFVGAMKRVQP